MKGSTLHCKAEKILISVTEFNNLCFDLNLQPCCRLPLSVNLLCLHLGIDICLNICGPGYVLSIKYHDTKCSYDLTRSYSLVGRTTNSQEKTVASSLSRVNYEADQGLESRYSHVPHDRCLGARTSGLSGSIRRKVEVSNHATITFHAAEGRELEPRDCHVPYGRRSRPRTTGQSRSTDVAVYRDLKRPQQELFSVRQKAERSKVWEGVVYLA